MAHDEADRSRSQTRELIRRMRQGDHEAWRLFSLRYEGILRAISHRQLACRRRLIDPTELVNISLINLYNFLKERSTNDSLDTTALNKVLFTIIQRRAIDEWRRYKRRASDKLGRHKPHASLEELRGDGRVEPSELGREDDPDERCRDMAMEASLPQLMLRFIETLPEDLQELARLILLEGLSATQVRERLRLAGARVPGIRMLQVRVRRGIVAPLLQFLETALEGKP